MKRLLPIVIILLFVTLSCELFIEEPSADTVYAIYIALDYEGTGLRPLKGTLPDAKEQYEAFETISEQAGLGYHGYTFLQENGAQPIDHEIGDATVNSYPTFNNIKAAINAISALAKEGDLTIVTFSGHAEAGLIALIDAQDQDQSYEVSLILDELRQVKGRKLVLLDACETGFSIPSSPSSSSTLLENSIATWYSKYFSSARVTKNDLFVISSSAHTDSYEVKVGDHCHGDFTQTLLKGLGWDHAKDEIVTSKPPAAVGKQLTTDGLLSYIKANQSIPTRRTFINPASEIQHPMVSGGALDMVLFSF